MMVISLMLWMDYGFYRYSRCIVYAFVVLVDVFVGDELGSGYEYLALVDVYDMMVMW